MKHLSTDLDSRIIYSILSVVIVVAMVYSFYDFFLGYYLSCLTDLLMTGLCVIAYYLIKYKNAYHYIAIPVIYTIFALCISDFFVKYGFYGSSQFNFLIIGFVIALLFESHKRLVLLSIYGIIISFLFYIQIVHYQYIKDLYTERELYTVLFDFVIYTVLMIYLARIIRSEYIKEKALSIKQQKILQKQQKEIVEKNQEILTQQEEITSFNEQLEILIKIRTEQLEFKNKQLDDYVYFNTIKVQQPLAQLVTLASDLHTYLDTKDAEIGMPDLTQMVHLSNELDQITKEINQILAPSSNE